MSLPSAEDGFTLEAQPPVGRDLVYVVVTSVPVTRSSLGISSRDVVVFLNRTKPPRSCETCELCLMRVYPERCEFRIWFSKSMGVATFSIDQPTS